MTSSDPFPDSQKDLDYLHHQSVYDHGETRAHSGLVSALLDITLRPSIMGLPYSKQLNYAFDQVTPLVAAGFRVLETTRDIGILVALIQVLTCLLLGLILAALLALLITVNPDLELERQAIVTPTMKWLASWVAYREERRWLEITFVVILGGVVIGAWAGSSWTREQHQVLIAPEERTGDELAEEVIESTET